jgi:hypothetical protein
MIKAQQSWVQNCDMPKYNEGDRVWLEGKNLQINQPTAKLAPRRYSPFKVIKVLSPVSYQLQLPTQWSIHPVFHIDLLTPYRETIMHGPNYQYPVPDLVDGEEEYSVEKILDSRKFGRRRCLQYLIKWEGYPDSDNMWVDKDDVFADDKVREFKRLNPAKETHIRNLSSAKLPYPSALQHSHLLSQHTHQYMSSNGRSDLAEEVTAGVYADSASDNNNAINCNIQQMVEERTLPYLELRQPHLNPDLHLHPTTPSLMPSDNSHLLMPPSLALQVNPNMSLHFACPKPLSLGMLTAREWHREQLLEARKQHNLKNRRRQQAGMILLARCHPLISDSAINAMDQENTAMAMSLQPPLQSPLPSSPSLSPHHPLAPTQWRTFASLVKKPCLWRTTLPTPSKSVVKIPLKYRLPTTKTDQLPKGWVYNMAEVKEEDHASPLLYTTPCRPLTRAMRTEVLKQRADPYRQLCRGTKTTKGPVTSLSLS